MDKISHTGLSRRDFLQMMGTGVSSAFLLAGCGSQKHLSTWRVLTEEEAILVEALTEQIIPTDHDPGAREAGCVHFIDRQLAGFYREHLDTYRRGLVGVDQSSEARHGQPFLKCTWDQQTELLKQIEAGQAEGAIWQEVDSRHFFRLVRDHTLQGFYGSPRHGGNRDYVSYRMIGLDYPQIVGQNRYRDS